MKKNIIIILILCLILSSFVLAVSTEKKSKDDLNLIKEKYIKHDNNLKHKLINDDLDINSNLNYCSKGVNNSIICDIDIDKNEIIWFDDIFKGKIEPIINYENNNKYIVVFENVFSGKLHIGEKSDISFIGVEPFIYYFPSNIDNYTVVDESLSLLQINATLENGATIYVNTTLNNAYFNLSNVNDYVNITPSSNMDLSTNATINFWVQFAHINPSTPYQTMFSMGGYSYSGRLKFFEIIFTAQERISAEMENNGGSTRANYVTTETLDADGLYHMITVNYCYNCGGQSKFDIYIDGLETTPSYTSFGSVGTLEGDTFNRIGNDRILTYDFDGNLSNFLFFKNSMLTLSEIEDLYNLTNPLKNYYTIPTVFIINPIDYDNWTGVHNINYMCRDDDGLNSYIHIDDEIIYSGDFYDTEYTFNFSTLDIGFHNLTIYCDDAENNISKNVIFYSYYTIGSEIGGLEEDGISGVSNNILILVCFFIVYIGLFITGIFSHSFNIVMSACFLGIIIGIITISAFSLLSVVFILINSVFIYLSAQSMRN